MNRPRFIVASAAWLTLVATAGGSCVSSAAGASDPVDVIYPEIESLYIDLHRNPELAFHEQRTAGVLAERVKALGYEVFDAPAGIVAGNPRIGSGWIVRLAYFAAGAAVAPDPRQIPTNGTGATSASHAA